MFCFQLGAGLVEISVEQQLRVKAVGSGIESKGKKALMSI